MTAQDRPMIPEHTTVALAGGYGRLGLAVARQLLQETSVSVRLLGRDGARAEQAAAGLCSRFGRGRAAACRADARSADELIAALDGANPLVVCTTDAGHTAELARAVLAAGVDCVDLRYPQAILRDWRACEEDLREAGRCVLTQAGHLPGLPGIFLRYAHARNPRIRNVVLATAIRPRHPISVGAAAELVEELRACRSAVFAGWISSAALEDGCACRCSWKNSAGCRRTWGWTN